MVKSICVVTGSRSEYGLLAPLMRRIAAEPSLQLQVVATGTHLSLEFGLTYRQIEADGFTIDAKVEMLLSADTPSAVAKSMGLGTIGLADALSRLKPDLLLLLGDRFEALAAAQSAMVMKIPIVHLHGGETTRGAIDEAIRHAITKMSHLHFVAAEPYRRRVIQLGEHPDTVFNVGALGVEGALGIPLLDRRSVEERLGFELGDQLLLVTYHPETLSSRPATEAMFDLVNAATRVENARIVVTYPNADASGRTLIRVIEDCAARFRDRMLATQSLGQVLYLSVMKHARVVVGNSSSGLIEAPCFGVPTVNVGLRQSGRLRAESVIDCADDEASIFAALKQALSSTFAERCRSVRNPYGCGDTSRRIVEVLAGIDNDARLLKTFYDVPPPA